MKKAKMLLAMLLALVLVLSFSASAFAAGPEYNNTKGFLTVLDAHEIVYEYLGIDDDKDEGVKIVTEGDYKDEIVAYVYFNEDDDVVTMCSFYVVEEFNKKDLVSVFRAVNELHKQYKFVCFVVDEEDYSVDSTIDIPLRDCDEAGEIAFDALYYLVTITDEAYDQLKEFEK